MLDQACSEPSESDQAFSESDEAFSELDQAFSEPDQAFSEPDQASGEDDQVFGDDELGALALAVGPDQPLAADAVPIGVYLGQRPDPLPSWYMPAAVVRCGSRWRIPVVGVVVGAFLIIEALGLCNTFGSLGFA